MRLYARTGYGVRYIVFSLVFITIWDPFQYVNCASLSDVADIYDGTREVVHDVLKAWDIIGPNVLDDKITPPLLKSKEKKVINRLSFITTSVSLLESRLTSTVLSAIGELQNDLPQVVRFELRLDDLLAKTAIIESADQKFKDYLHAGVHLSTTTPSYNETNSTSRYHDLQFERYTLENFAENIVSHAPNSVAGVMEQMHSLLAPETWRQQLLYNEGGILVQIRKAVEEAQSNLCSIQQSPQQLIFNIYMALQMTQLKGYTMMQFSWMLLRLYNRGNFTLEATKSREKYLNRMRLQVHAAKKAMEHADQSMWRCDPDRHVDGETYTEITRLLQGYIQNEVDMNSEQTCKENCGYYSYTQQFGCFKNQFCQEQPKCRGKIVDCQYLDSDMTICQADSSSDIRYNWIKYENGNTLGDTSKSCARQSKVDSWWRWLFWHCSYCFCLCDDPYFSDRYFNLRPVISDVDNNKVITAVRFHKNDHIIHLQIQEGVMLPKGAIDESTITWRKCDEYKTGSTGIEGKDYHMLSWNERGIDLDDIKSNKPNYVMTGIKFRKFGPRLNLEILLTPFNFTTGHLIYPNEKSEWLSNDNTEASDRPRTEVKLNKPDMPTRMKSHRPNSNHDQFLSFTHTDIYKDVAQHTVPFLDTQIVGPSPPTPLSGMGLMHKGLDGSGGYIAPKVFTYNMAQHLQENFEEPVVDKAVEKY